MPKKRGQHAKDVRLARQRAKVRFGPERSTLTALLGEARSGLASDLSSADAAARSAIHFARKAEKPVAAIYDQARTEADTARQDVQTAFGKLGAGADPFRAATAREQGGRLQRIAGAGASALGDLQQRQLEAVAGGQYAREQAKAEFRKTNADLLKRYSDLNDRMGAFVAQEAGSIADKRAGRKATTRGIRLRGRQAEDLEGIRAKHRTDLEKLKANLKPKQPGGAGLPEGVKPATRSELRGFRANVSKARSYAQQFYDQGDPRHKAATDLTRGVTPTSTSPVAVPSIGDQLALSVALDMAYDGHVSRANARKLKQAGIRVRDIPGAISYTRYEKRRRNQQLASGAS